MKYFVKLYPDTVNWHLSQIYAGLNQLHKSKIIRLSHQLPDYEKQRSLTSHTLWLNVTDANSGVKKSVCYDLVDASEIASEDGLQKCDVYFKRSFERLLIKEIAPGLSSKIKPYGLNVPCVSEHVGILLRQLLLYYMCPANIGSYENRTSRFDLLPFLRFSVTSMSQFLPSRIFHRVSNYSSHLLDKPVTGTPLKRVLFQTQLYNPETMPDTRKDVVEATKQINEQRVGLVRALKRELGQRFVGGLLPNSYTERYYKDAITTLETERESYLDAVKRSLVTVSTRGLHNSIPWKIPEYLATGRCIVTERLAYELPNSLVYGRHALVFQTVDECLAACYKLLENDQLALEMQKSNLVYYETFVQPPALILNTLNAAFQN